MLMKIPVSVKLASCSKVAMWLYAFINSANHFISLTVTIKKSISGNFFHRNKCYNFQ